MARSPIAQSKTSECSGLRLGAFSTLPCAAICSTMASICSGWYPRFFSARGTVVLTMRIDAPPTSFLFLTRARSGSMPVVSQSIIRPIVPVGASTLAWALRQPLRSPSARHCAHAVAAASSTRLSSAPAERTASVAAARPDRLGREGGEADGDVHRGDDELDDLAEGGGVEGVVRPQELQQIDGGEVAGGVVEAEVLTAGVAGRDAAGLRVGVPVVDGVVVLQAGVGALPGRLGNRAEQCPGVDRLQHGAIEPGAQRKVPAVLHRVHELVADSDGVVGVLVLDAGDVLAAEVHVEAGVPQDANLLLFPGLEVDELLDVGMVDVEHDHLRGPSGSAPGLNRAGGGVCTAHERHRSRCGAAATEQLPGRPNPGQVQPGTGTALEDQTLLAVPVEDRVHRVLDGQDEAG